MRHGISLPKIALALFAANAILLGLYMLDHFTGRPSMLLHSLFDLDGEGNVPAWYSSSQLLAAGLLFLASASGPRRTEAVPGWFFLLVGLGFLFLSLDESAGIHERVTVNFRHIEFLPRFAGDRGVWISLYLAAIVLVASLTARYWWRLWKLDRRGFIKLAAGAATFLLGAVGLEIASYGNLRSPEMTDLYALQVAAEETLELCGSSLMVLGALSVFQRVGAARQRE